MSWRALAAEVLNGDPAAAAPTTATPPAPAETADEGYGHDGHAPPLALVRDRHDAHAARPQRAVTPPPEGLLSHLDAMRAQKPPGGLSALRWMDALDRAEAALQTWGASAAAFGWTADDLLDVDLAAWMRLDRRGALLLHPDADVVGLTDVELIIRKGRTVFRIRRRSAI